MRPRLTLTLSALVALTPLSAGTPIFVPAPLVAKLDALAEKEGLDPQLLRSVAWVESGFNPQAKSPLGALGLLQVLPATAKANGATNLDDADQVLAAGARHLRKLMDLHRGQVGRALAAYNGGQEAVASGKLSAEALRYRELVQSVYAAKAVQPETPLADGELRGVVRREGRRLSVTLAGRLRGGLTLDLIPAAAAGEPGKVRYGATDPQVGWSEVRPHVVLLDGPEGSASLGLRAQDGQGWTGELSVPLKDGWGAFSLRLATKP